MPEWLIAVLIFAAYIILVRFVLPKMGVPT